MSSSTFTRRVPPAAPAAQTGRMLVLEPVVAALRPIVLAPGRYHVGSGEDCHIRVNVPGVAPRHCLIVVGPHRSVVKSLAPLTWLNDGVFREAALNPGDRLMVGPIEWRVSDPKSAADVAESPANEGVQLLCDDALSRVELSQSVVAARREWEQLAHAEQTSAGHAPPAQSAFNLDEQRSHLQQLAASLTARELEVVARETDVRCHWEDVQKSWAAVRELDQVVRRERAVVAGEHTELLAARQAIRAVRLELDDARAELGRRALELSERESSLRLRADDVVESHSLIATRTAELQRREAEWAEREQQLSQRAAELAALDSHVAERVRAADERWELLAERERVIGERESPLTAREQQLSTRAQELAGWEQALTERQQRIDELEQQHARWESERQTQDGALAEREHRLHESEQCHAHWEAEREAREQALANREQALAENERQCNDRQQGLSDREQQLAARDSELTDRDRTLTDRENQVQDRTADLSDWDARLTARERDVTQQQQSANEREFRLDERHSGLSQWEERLAAREQELSHRDQELTHRHAELDERDRASSERDAQFGERDQRLSEWSDQLSAREQEVAQGIELEQAALRSRRDEFEREQNEFAAARDELDRLRSSHEADEAIWDKRRSLLDLREQDLEKRAAQLDRAASDLAARSQDLPLSPQQTVLIGSPIAELLARPHPSDWEVAAPAIHQAASKDLLDERMALDSLRERIETERIELAALRAEWDAKVETDFSRREELDRERSRLDALSEELRAARVALDAENEVFAEQRRELRRQLREFAIARGAPPDLVIIDELPAGASAAAAPPLASESAIETAAPIPVLAPPAFAESPLSDEQDAEHDGPSRNAFASGPCATIEFDCRPAVEEFGDEPFSNPSGTLPALVEAAGATLDWRPLDELSAQDFMTSTGVYDAGGDSVEDRSDETIAFPKDIGLVPVAEPVEPAEPETPNEDDSVMALRARLAEMFGLSGPTVRVHDAPPLIPVRNVIDTVDASQHAFDGVREAAFSPSPHEADDHETLPQAAPIEHAAHQHEPAAHHNEVAPAPTPPLPGANTEENIRAYMEKLLARSKPKLEVPADLYADEPTADSRSKLVISEVPDRASPPPPPKPIAPEDKEAIRANLDSFRELANISARSAVAKHQSSKLQTDMQVKFIVLGIAMGLTFLLWLAGWFSPGSYFMYTAAAAITAMVMLADVVRNVLTITRLRSMEAAGEYEVEVAATRPPIGPAESPSESAGA